MHAANDASDELFRGDRSSSDQGRAKARGALATPLTSTLRDQIEGRARANVGAAVSQNAVRPRPRTIRTSKTTTTTGEVNTAVSKSSTTTATDRKRLPKGVRRPRRPITEWKRPARLMQSLARGSLKIGRHNATE
jgi:hypothetical protein